MFNPLVKNLKRLLSFLLLFFGSFFTSQSQVLLTATGSSNSFTVQYPANLNAISGGMMVTFFSNQNITGSATLSLNGLAANGIFKNVNQPLSSGDILIGQPITVIFDGTYWQLLSTSANVPTSNLWTVSGINLYPSNLTNKVGIGTASPQNTLHVVGGTRIGSLTTGGAVFATTNGDLYVGSIGGILGSGTPGGIAFWANNNTITSNGANLFWNNTLPGFGIGSASPTALLDVNGTTRIRNLTVASTATGLRLVQADGLGNLSITTSTSLYLWTLSGVNIQPANTDLNINLGTTTGFYGISGNPVVQQLESSSIFLGGAGNSNSTGLNNVFNGFQAGYKNTTGHNNTFEGWNAGYANTIGYGNAFYGYQAGQANVSGIQNTFIGVAAGFSNTIGSYNSFNGWSSGYNNDSGSNNVFVGYNAGNINTSGSNNVALGVGANFGLGTLTNSIAIGYGAIAGASNTLVLGGTGTSAVNVGIGIATPAATLDVAGNINTLYGTTGGIYLNYSPFLWGDINYNISLGMQSGNPGGTSGTWNTYIGEQSGASNLSGQYNIFMGGQAGYRTTSGTYNVFVGMSTGFFNTAGSNNVIVGAESGFNNVTGNNLLILGSGANVSADGFTNAIAIGSNAVVGGSNTMVLGGTGTNAVKVGIGTTTPQTLVHVFGGTGSGGGAAYSSLVDLAVEDDNQTFIELNGVTWAGLSFNANSQSIYAGMFYNYGSNFLQFKTGGADDRIVISQTGNVGIGLSSPAYLLDVNGTVRISPGSTYNVIIDSDGGSNPQIRPSATGAWGSLGTSAYPWWYTYSWYFYALASNDYLVISDSLLKTNVRPLESALEKVNKIKSVRYDLREDTKIFPSNGSADHNEKGRINLIGFMAQDIEEVFPELVKIEPGSGYKSVGYLGFVPILTQAVQEQQSQIEKQSKEIDQLRQELEELKKIVELKK